MIITVRGMCFLIKFSCIIQWHNDNHDAAPRKEIAAPDQNKNLIKPYIPARPTIHRSYVQSLQKWYGGEGGSALGNQSSKLQSFFFSRSCNGILWNFVQKKREIILTQNRKVCKGRRQDDITLLI